MEIYGQGGVKDKQTNHPNNCTAKEHRWKQRTVVSQGRGDEPAWGHRGTVVKKIVPKWKLPLIFQKGQVGEIEQLMDGRGHRTQAGRVTWTKQRGSFEELHWFFTWLEGKECGLEG